MTKSLGNVVNPFLASDILTTDGLRYFLLKQGTLHSDASKFFGNIYFEQTFQVMLIIYKLHG
jgi:methionyl-tRNA synthetase